jgi:phosphonopyruvate decarboxylase
MIDVKKIVKILKKNQIKLITGVPDSVLKNFTNEIANDKFFNHVITPSEGSAVAAGMGYNLATNKIPLIYFQNSGLGNAINPIISLTNKKIYSTAFIYFIGWRGAPNTKDEAQHLPNGLETKNFLKSLGLKVHEVNNDKDLKKISRAIFLVKTKNIPQCILFKKDKLTNSSQDKKNIYRLSKEDIFNAIYSNTKSLTYIFSSTGFISRSLFNFVDKNKNKLIKCFYLVGGMGHTFAISQMFAYFKKNKKVICIDGDGSLLMHMGSLNLNKTFGTNLIYILLNNECHDSVGGQKTNIENLNLKNLSNLFGFDNYYFCKNKKDLVKNFEKIKNNKKTIFFDCRISNENQKLPRPENFIKIKNKFIL